MSEETKLDFRTKLNNMCKRVWDGTKDVSRKIWEGTKSVSKKAYRGFMSAKTFWSAFAILVILLIISIVVLSIRLYDYTKTDDRAVSLRSSMDETLDVFAVEYENESGEVTIKGADGKKVIAPGSRVEYTLRLRNTDKVALDYAFTPDLKHTTRYDLPIMIRLLDPNDEYVIGSETEWVMLQDVKAVECTGTLMKNETAEYIFQWQWPYEWGEDEYDTYLASIRSEDNLGVSFSFGIHSEANTEIKANGSFFSSHAGRITVIVIIAILLAVAIALLLIYIIKRKGNLAPAPAPEPVMIPVEVPFVEEPSVEIPEVPTPVESVEEIPEPIVIETFVPRFAFSGKMDCINIDVLERSFNDGDVINIGELKARGLIRADAKQIKILARASETLDKAFTVETQGISKNAEAAIRRAGGRVIITAPDGRA